MIKDVLDGLLSLLTPPCCICCYKCIDGMHLYCQECLDSLQLLDREYRCFRCFSLKETSYCSSCVHFPLIYRRGALFEKSEQVCALLRERKQKRALAALFVYQIHRLDWPIFDHIYSDSKLSFVLETLLCYYGMKRKRRGIVKQSQSVLYISAGDEDVRFPFSATCGRLFHLPFFLSN